MIDIPIILGAVPIMSASPGAHSEVTIIEFRPKYARQFSEINREWLEEYFEVEPYDEIVLNDPRGQIIAHGGYVFFAMMDDKVVGTCALLRHAEKKYELAKMGVRKPYRGRGIGRRLTEAAIEKVRSLGADTLILATSNNLEAANRLYHSMGFHQVDIAEIGPLPYKRKSIVLRMMLSEGND
jgi:GNAT superfamily N-acetyltransferase